LRPALRNIHEDRTETWESWWACAFRGQRRLRVKTRVPDCNPSEVVWGLQIVPVVNRNLLPEFNPRRKKQDVHARTLIQNRASLQGWRGLQFICGLRGNKMKTKSLLVLASMMSVLLYR